MKIDTNVSRVYEDITTYTLRELTKDQLMVIRALLGAMSDSNVARYLGKDPGFYLSELTKVIDTIITDYKPFKLNITNH